MTIARRPEIITDLPDEHVLSPGVHYSVVIEFTAENEHDLWQAKAHNSVGVQFLVELQDQHPAARGNVVPEEMSTEIDVDAMTGKTTIIFWLVENENPLTVMIVGAAVLKVAMAVMATVTIAVTAVTIVRLAPVVGRTVIAGTGLLLLGAGVILLVGLYRRM